MTDPVLSLPNLPPFPLYGNIKNFFLKSNTILYRAVGDVRLREFVVKGEQQLELSAKHDSHVQLLHKVFCKAHSSKPQHRRKLKY